MQKIATFSSKGNIRDDVNDYKLLMNRCMDSQIKPFVDRFIATLEEYRENYKKIRKAETIQL